MATVASLAIPYPATAFTSISRTCHPPATHVPPFCQLQSLPSQRTLSFHCSSNKHNHPHTADANIVDSVASRALLPAARRTIPHLHPGLSAAMSTFTFSDLSFMRREQLASLLRAKTAGVSIIDVRDDDYVGGHIVTSQNIPVHTHDYRMPELVRTLRDQDTVIFHCALSQQRGPGSALRYLRERERMSGKGEVGARKEGVDLVKAQKVYVLDGGFSKWQEIYGEDKELTEGYAKDICNPDW